jgi:hypothetical protein
MEAHLAVEPLSKELLRAQVGEINSLIDVHIS